MTGVGLLYYPFGNGVFHAIAPSLLTYLFIRRFPDQAGTLTWLTVFPMLVYNHVCGASGMAWRQGAIDFTGAQMVLTLRLISAAVCVTDGRRLARHEATGEGRPLPPHAARMALRRPPSALEFSSYLFAAGNLLAGPHYDLAEFREYVERGSDTPWALGAGLLRFLKALACLAGHLALSEYGFTADLYSSERWAKSSLARRVLLLWAVGFAFRLKYYFAWCVAESGLILSGQDPPPTYSRHVNARVLAVEMQPSFAALAVSWNVQTGSWLRRYVYERLARPGVKPSVVTVLATQVVSGAWHGLYPGYWAFFVTSAFLIEASKVVHRYEQGWPKAVRDSPVVWLLRCAYTTLKLNYTAAAFEVLTWSETIQVWRDVFFIGHLAAIVPLIMAFGMPPKGNKDRKHRKPKHTEVPVKAPKIPEEAQSTVGGTEHGVKEEEEVKKDR